MTTLDILLRAILNDPSDDLVRLAYADALEERGRFAFGVDKDDIVAARIRYQVGDPSRWCRVFEGEFTFVERRGFFDEIECTTAQWKKHGKRLVREHPITRVRLTDKTPEQSTINPERFYIAKDYRRLTGRPHYYPTWIWDRVGRVLERSGTEEELLRVISDACLAWAKSRCR